MKIRSKLYLTTFSLLFMILLIGSAQLFSNQRLNTIYETQKNVDRIFFLVSATNRITLDYLWKPSDRAYNQLIRIEGHFDDVFARTTLASPPQSRLLKKIRRNYDSFLTIFDVYVEKVEKHHVSSDLQLKELLDRISSQLMVQTADIVSDTTRLSELVRSDLQKIHEQNRVIVLSTVIIVSIFILLISILITRSITKPIYEISTGTRRLGKGDLEYRITKKSNDEIGELSEAFNLMAGNLNRVTVSREKLALEIEERKLAEENLRKSEGKYRNIFENIQDVYYETSLDGTILEVSPSIETVSGYKRKELIGKSLNDFYTGPIARREFLNVIIHSGKVANYEVTLTDKDGSAHPVELTTILQRNEKGDPLKIVGSLRDISERKQLESKLIQSQKMESIGNLAGGIAHDFNNILSSIIGFTELALDEVTKGTSQEENLQEVYTAGKRARDLVNQILAFARQADEERKPLQMDTIVKEVLKLIRSTIPTSIVIKEEIKSHSLILGNSSQVHQLFMNLCTNAAQAMEDEGGILEVRLTDFEYNGQPSLPVLELKTGNYIKLTVSDTGPGISPDIIDSIFEPYFTTKGVGEGTGMGLALVHGIVESYGGKIIVESELGKGTVFTTYLPLTKKRENYRPYQNEKLPTGTERILFVDDELPIAKMGSRILESLGYQVTYRTSSVEALELFRLKADYFDLVISDVTMPAMTGNELAMELMAIRSTIPVILCTGYSKKISEETASEFGIKAFAYKPIEKSDLAKTVRKVLDVATS